MMPKINAIIQIINKYRITPFLFLQLSIEVWRCHEPAIQMPVTNVTAPRQAWTIVTVESNMGLWINPVPTKLKNEGPITSANEKSSNTTATSIKVPCLTSCILLFKIYPEITMDSVAICKKRFNVAINTRLFINYQKGVLLAKNNKLTLNVPAHQFLKTNIPEVFAIRHYYNKPSYDFDLFPKLALKCNQESG